MPKGIEIIHFIQTLVLVKKENCNLENFAKIKNF